MSVSQDRIEHAKKLFFDLSVIPPPKLEEICDSLSISYFPVYKIAQQEGWTQQRRKLANSNKPVGNDRQTTLLEALQLFDGRTARLIEHLDNRLASDEMSDRDAITYLKTLDSIKARIEKEMASNPVDSEEKQLVDGLLAQLDGLSVIAQAVRERINPNRNHGLDPLGNRSATLAGMDD